MVRANSSTCNRMQSISRLCGAFGEKEDNVVDDREKKSGYISPTAITTKMTTNATTNIANEHSEKMHRDEKEFTIEVENFEATENPSRDCLLPIYITFRGIEISINKMVDFHLRFNSMDQSTWYVHVWMICKIVTCQRF